MLDTNQIKKEFPIFGEREGLIYLDSASTTQKPQCVINSVSSFYSNYNANVHRALYEIGEKATNEFESVRDKIKKFLNVPDSHEVIFTRSTTESINLVAYSWGMSNLNREKGILFLKWNIIAILFHGKLFQKRPPLP